MTRDDDELTRAMMRHPSNAHKMIRDVEAFANAAALKGIDVTPLHTASAFHAELNRELVVQLAGHPPLTSGPAGDAGSNPVKLNPWTSQSRWRKARWHNRFAVALLMVCSMLFGAVVYFASDAHADVYGAVVA